jgi:hypothetical protein
LAKYSIIGLPMKITDIIRSVLDIVDGAEASSEPAVAVEIAVEPEAELMDMQRLAGILADPEYANEPNTVVAPIGAAFPAGDDVHHAKNPADIRTNAPSMFPGFQARM